MWKIFVFEGAFEAPWTIYQFWVCEKMRGVLSVLYQFLSAVSHPLPSRAHRRFYPDDAAAL